MYNKIALITILILILNCVNGDTNNTQQQQQTSSTQVKTESQSLQDKNKTSSVSSPTPTTSSSSSISNATAEKCSCDGGLIPRIGENGKELEICPHCKCKYEDRNSTLIKIVVIIVIWVISILVIYMLFLMCLDPLLNKRVKANYQEHTNEDDDTASVSGPQLQQANAQEMNTRGNSSNVLNRVGHQQDKWKRQVREQRKNIYDRRTMLN
ncbi:uncharacterized protein CG1161 [Condylostylus longicornis]|uniref:uncharacterized protein CG1161 n=1 Tax=Condylostylus longicornis TaxID=2530218 RepID=UPI00244E3190|nr:uncharacterized protein CG1161 [Condylostylus longicornis]